MYSLKLRKKHQQRALNLLLHCLNRTQKQLKSPGQNKENHLLTCALSFPERSFPNSNVSLSIPGLLQQQVIAKSDGTWTFKSINDLPQGKLTITATGTDSEGNKTTVSRVFNIFQQGSQIVESATPSATPTIKPIRYTASYSHTFAYSN